MRLRGLVPFIGAVCLLAACGPAPTPTPTPTPTPAPTVTRAPVPTTTAYDYRGLPGCDGFQVLATPIKFTWVGIEDVQDASDWGYYHCAKSVSDVAGFYREKMIIPPYNWGEFNWVVLPEGTLGVYFHTAYQRWLYLWMLPDPAGSGVNLVLAQRDLEAPLDLPCCH